MTDRLTQDAPIDALWSRLLSYSTRYRYSTYMAGYPSALHKQHAVARSPPAVGDVGHLLSMTPRWMEGRELSVNVRGEGSLTASGFEVHGAIHCVSVSVLTSRYEVCTQLTRSMASRPWETRRAACKTQSA